ncbi:penicillin-binding transpeptidase domain-containing protein [Photobacterium leiognathi]|uniref:penicillin-binding transpeptidase domain-containing protein n=1 Tax=Photobacterium leiognathi TaxID=553611 RepID=UPI0029815E33|nr:penicillin-binding transpeptidase domain-containing protein [Photobacterium leiognathi]
MTFLIRKRVQESISLKKRARCIFLLLSVSILSVLILYIPLQIIDHEHYKKKAFSNTFKIKKLEPSRGRILDRHGVVIARNKPNYSISINRSDLKSKDDIHGIIQTVNTISNLNLKIEDAVNSGNNIIFQNSVSIDEINNILKYIDKIPALSISSIETRDYPYRESMAHLLGFTKLDPINRITIGMSGIEKLFNKSLSGEQGVESVQVTPGGKILNKRIIETPIRGLDITTSIDAKLQNHAYDILKNHGNSAFVAIDIHTGDILSLLSTPSFDPNLISSNKKQVLETTSFFDRSRNGLYPPASTIKPFIGASLLDGKWIDPTKKIWSGPYFKIGNQKFRDWKRTGHGKIDFYEAMAVSSDVFFYRSTYESGINYTSDYLKYFKFGQPIPNFLHNKKGILPSPKWKKDNKNQQWYAGDTANTSIGQGFFLVTPLQLGYATAILASGNLSLSLNITRNDIESNASKKISEDLLQTIHNSLGAVVDLQEGTANSLKGKFKSKIALKTGTAQVFNTSGKIDYDNEKVEKKFRDHGILIGFYPLTNPKIAFSLVMENSGGSKSTLPVIKKIIEFYDEYY